MVRQIKNEKNKWNGRTSGFMEITCIVVDDIKDISKQFMVSFGHISTVPEEKLSKQIL